MDLSQIVSNLKLKILNEAIEGWEDYEVSGGFCSDLLSIVMAESEEKNIWITKQVHINIVAVAVIANLSGIIVCGKKPDLKTVEKATVEGIPVLYTENSVFDTAGMLYQLIISNKGC